MNPEDIPPETKRVTISLTHKVWKWGQELMAAGGYATFSALIADLIRDEMRKTGHVPPENHSKSRHPE